MLYSELRSINLIDSKTDEKKCAYKTNISFCTLSLKYGIEPAMLKILDLVSNSVSK